MLAESEVGGGEAAGQVDGLLQRLHHRSEDSVAPIRGARQQRRAKGVYTRVISLNCSNAPVPVCLLKCLKYQTVCGRHLVVSIANIFMMDDCDSELE